MQLEIEDDNVWYPTVVKEVGDADVLLYYPKTREEERLASEDIQPGMLRRLLDAAIIKQKEYTATTSEITGDPGLSAIKKLKDVTPRETMSSALHERMHKVWDAITSVGDGYYRPRAKHFMKLPSRSAVPEYYEHIKRPIHLEAIRKSTN
jgi:hypothetical protein